jgi:hypothetical protein
MNYREPLQNSQFELPLMYFFSLQGTIYGLVLQIQLSCIMPSSFILAKVNYPTQRFYGGLFLTPSD